MLPDADCIVASVGNRYVFFHIINSKRITINNLCFETLLERMAVFLTVEVSMTRKSRIVLRIISSQADSKTRRRKKYYDGFSSK